MNKHIFLLALSLLWVLFHPAGGFAQSDNDTLKRLSTRLVILPSHLIDPINPALQVGVETGFGKHHAIQVQGGLILNQDLLSALVLLAPQDSAVVVVPRKGYKLRMEYRYYLDPLGEQVHPYLAIDLQYQQSAYGITQAYRISDTSFDYGFDFDIENGFVYDDDHRVMKTKLGINGKVGVLFVISRFITIDCYGGLGLFRRVIEHENRLNPADPAYGKGIYITDDPGTRYLPNLQVGFSLGFQF